MEIIMFTIKEIKAVLKSSSGEFVNIPYTELTIKEANLKYVNIYLYLDSSSSVYGLPFENIPQSVVASGIGFTDYVNTITETNVPELDLVPKVPLLKRLRYFSFWPYSDEVKLGNISAHPDMELTTDLQKDMWFTSTVNHELFKKNALFTVAGVIHKHDYNDTHGILLGAGNTLHTSNTNSIGILDFSELGGMDILDITEENMYVPSGNYINNTYVKIPKGLDEITPYLVVAGKLITKPGLMKVVGDNLVKINLSSRDMVELHHELTALTGAELDVTLGDGGQVMNESLREDKYVKSLLLSHYSFIVLVKSTGHATSIDRLSDLGLPGVYKAEDTNLPIMYDHGYVADYVVDQIDVKGITVKTYNYTTNRPIRLTGDNTRAIASTHQNILRKPLRYSGVGTLNISRQELG